MNLAYLVHNLNDPAVERRCRMFEAGGATIRIAGFSRDPELRSDIAKRQPMMLGQSADAAFARRALSTLKTAFFAPELAEFFRPAEAVVARNLEQLAIARRLIGGRRLVYECLDIHRSLTSSDPASRLVQAIEAALLPRVDLLLTSSPAFLRNHFSDRPVGGPAMLVENKVLILADNPGSALPTTARAAPLPAQPLRIGWFGMLRCRRTFEFLRNLVRQADGRIMVTVGGKPSAAELPTLEQDIAAADHMEFTGPYSYADLPQMYADCHFAWTIDWFEEGRNSSWLLPNRLYEALAFGAIPIALADIELGRWLKRHQVGLLVDEPKDAARQLLELSPDELRKMQSEIAKLDRSDLVADKADCEQLIARIGEVEV